MRSIVRVTSASAAPYHLTTVDRVKLELNILDDTFDDLIETKINECGSIIQGWLAFTLAKETVEETFRGSGPLGSLVLDRTPISEILSITLDGSALTTDDYEVDTKKGILYRIDASGYTTPWQLAYSSVAVVNYIGGFVLPGSTSGDSPDDVTPDLEPAIEAACVELVGGWWWSRGRDPLVKSENVPGLMSVDYWVGGVGKDGDLPPGVISKLNPFRRRFAV